MATEQIKTPYDDQILAGKTGLLGWLDQKEYAYRLTQVNTLHNKAEGYRRGVAETEARYAELVAAVPNRYKTHPESYTTIAYHDVYEEARRDILAALAKVKGEGK